MNYLFPTTTALFLVQNIHFWEKYSQLLEELNVATMTTEMFGGEVLVPPLFVIIKV